MAVVRYHSAVIQKIFFVHYLILLVVLYYAITSEALAAPYSSLLFKSKETFKLAELQNLEASLQITNCEQSVAYHHNDDDDDDTDTMHEREFAVLRYNCTRLLVDRATGSSLFRLDLQSKGKNNETFTTIKNSSPSMFSKAVAEDLLQSQILSLSSLQRSTDWIGQVIEEGHDPIELVGKLQLQRHDNLTSKFLSSDDIGGDIGEWTLDYVKMVGADDPALLRKAKTKPLYTMKSLLCGVAHEMPPRPSLNPALADSRFLVVDTTTATTYAIEDTELDSSSSCYLIRHINDDKRSPTTEKKSSQQVKWAARPFQYSSAINFEIAEMVIGILITLTDNNCKKDQRRVLFDPTCGSGTFLVLAIANGFYVEGYDKNPSAVDGTRRNLEYMFPKKELEEFAHVEIHDSCTPCRRDSSASSSSSAANISCVVGNLPWGKNSVLYINENERILRSVRSQIQVGTPCAFITRPSPNAGDNDKTTSFLFESTGFDVLGQSFVPQRDFSLPSGNKKKKKKGWIDNDDDDGGDGSRSQNQCVITIALAI
jgi:hypothetical protein